MPVLENPRHELFAQAIAKGESQRDAYRKAGFVSETDEAVDANASRLISTDKVSIRVQEIQSNAARRAEITAEKVLLELAKIGFADIRQVVQWGEAVAAEDENGELMAVQGVAVISSEKLSPEAAACIAEISKTKEGIKIKLHDKRAALVDIGRHLGMFTDKIQHTGKDGADLIPAMPPEEIAKGLAFILAKGIKGAGDGN